MEQEQNSRLARWRDWWNERTESQRDAWRFGLAAVVLGGVSVGGYFTLQPWWKGRQHRAALIQAEQFAEKQEYRDMLLALRRATQLAPGDIATWREVARRLSEIGSPETLRAQRNLVELSPQDVSLRLALVSEALRFGELDLAQQEFKGLESAAQRDVAFHRLAAALALALGREVELETALANLVAAEPANVTAKFNLAALRLWGADATKAATALEQLESLTVERAVRVRAALELLKHAARQHDPARVGKVVGLVLQRFSASGAPVTLRGEPPGWVQLIESLKEVSAASPGDCALTARWLAEVRLGRDALMWIDSLPEAQRRRPELLDVAAEISAREGDTIRLGFLLRAGAWDGMPDDAITLAFAARVQRQRGRADRAADTWSDAVGAAAASASGLRNLARLAGTWGDVAGSELALFALIERAPKSQWAYEALRTSCAARGDVPALWRVYEAWRKAQPENREVAVQWIRLSSLVDHAGPEVLAKARALHGVAPADPAIELALAAALWRAKQPGEAFVALGRLPERERQSTEASFWAALILADLGRKREGMEALTRAWRRELPTLQLELLRVAAGKIDAPMPR